MLGTAISFLGINGFVPLVLLLANIAVWAWLTVASFTARGAFVDFCTSQPFMVKVSHSPDLAGPVDVLFLPGYDAGSLPPPTPHQRWWGLVPNAHLDLVQESVEDLLWTRGFLHSLLVFQLVTQVFELGNLIFRGSSLDPGFHVQKFTTITKMGLLNLPIAAGMCSLYGIYVDPALGLPVVNYVPGWAYINFFVVLLIFAFVTPITFGLGMIHEQAKLVGLVVAIGIGVYFIFWIGLPLFNYAWIYSWKFVDDVASQELAADGAVSMSLTATQHVQLHDATAVGLRDPFKAAVYLGVGTFVVGFLGSVAAKIVTA